ncbi:MAG TPA: hypothetical protein VFZ34_05005 [Blastocatellia bacterium]|nr:hypothetical protein [Blastocatellia bacterium]
MPSDFLTEYRLRFRELQSNLNRDRYLYASGQTERSEANHYYAEASDLFTLVALAELQKELDAVASYRETEQAAIQLLLAEARHEHLRLQVRDLTEEIRAYEAQASVRWEGEVLSAQDVTVFLQQQPDARQRHELAARRAEITKGSQDLRAERWQKLHDAARELGFENYLRLYSEQRGISYETLAATMQSFLVQTESRYVSALSGSLLRDANVTLEEATAADLPYFRQRARFAQHFPAWELKHAYRETFSGLGILTYQQANLTLSENLRPHFLPGHFPIHVPDDIKIVYANQDGARSYEAFFHEVGHAQQFAWTSRQLYPEFQYCGDGAVREVFAMLFAGLLSDERWLSDMLSYQESNEFRHLLAVQRLLLLRRYAARLNYEIEFHSGQLTNRAGARYREWLTDVVRVQYDETEHLRDIESGFVVANTLRAAAFEAQLREQLKTKFGSRWWTSRKAGDYLIDLWNTGGRYKAEVMAKMIDLGELSFDWLAEECLANL